MGPVPAMPLGMGPPPPIPHIRTTRSSASSRWARAIRNPTWSAPAPAPCCSIKGTYYVVDMGNGAQNSMLRGAKGTFPFRDIAALCFTHFHQDHTNDYFDIMTNRWLTGGKEVTVVGPPGVAALHQFLTTFFKDDLCYRLLREAAAGHERHRHVRRSLTIKEITGVEEFQLGGLEVKTAKLTHTMYDLGLPLRRGGQGRWWSRATLRSTKRLVDLARGADMLVIDGDERWGGAPEHTMAPLEASGASLQARPVSTAGISRCGHTPRSRRSRRWPRPPR